MKILVVEDEPSLRELIQKSLEKERFVVEVAPDLFSAIDKVEVYDYDCILLDIMLLDGTGLEVLTRLNEVSKEYVGSHPTICYRDTMVYIEAKKETEPARILTTIFKDKEEQYYELEVSVPTIEKADLRNAILLMIVGLYMVMLLAFLIIHIWVFRRSMKPFYRLLQWLDVNRLGNKYEPLQNPTDIQEFRQLNEAVIQYATHSESLLEQQKQFIGHASHELQTPLAICRNRIEMLMEEEDLSEKQMEELAKTHQTLEHITKLNKSLLLLSKIENYQFSEVTEVNMNEIIHRYMDDYREVYDYMDITLNLEEKGNFNVCMNETLAVVLVTNLLKNAFVHNPPLLYF